DYYSTGVAGLTFTGAKTNNKAVDAMKGIIIGRNEQDIIEQTAVHSRKKQFHPTQKPTPLMERLINLVSDEGNIILDPFMGDRSFIGYEIDDEYFNIAEQRINEVIK
ncbi:DNA methyltransferase, partial [Klebsiella pneumoniae]